MENLMTVTGLMTRTRDEVPAFAWTTHGHPQCPVALNKYLVDKSPKCAGLPAPGVPEIGHRISTLWIEPNSVQRGGVCPQHG
ncbi:hypothetical protein NSPZN2_100430 [Nitrospira defluvii]|uniref:Uncharacterized protein n=1 Tax=Nitrospira defluvii TaxID=330214 RepID=A0ABM8R4L3_9BACT|nr:hypothetical protein NSPZN2_100430 [Nitrospira defluvii]